MMEQKNNNIILVGMPGVGKSTVGVVLAKILGRVIRKLMVKRQ